MTDSSNEVTRPEQAHRAPARVEQGFGADGPPANDELEATELQSLSDQLSASNLRRRNANLIGHASIRSEASTPPLSRTRQFWRDHVSLRVPPDKCRDHLALERTYLSYVRTSLALSNLGIVTCQLFRLSSSSNPSETDNYYKFGRPLANLFSAISIIVCLLGGWRFYRQQNAMARGKIRASGWELTLLTAFVAILILLLFFVTVAVAG